VHREPPGSAELWVVPRAGHAGAWAAEPEAYTARVIAFFDAALAG
jgi:hypothetical protein